MPVSNFIKYYSEKNIFIFIILFLSTGLVYWSRHATLETQEAQRAVRSAQEKVEQTENILRRQQEAYVQLVDSLQEKQDSLQEVSLQAGIRAARLEVNFAVRTEALVDSLVTSGDSAFAQIVRDLKVQHDSVTTELRGQVAALQDERALLWRRVEASDSLLATQVDLNNALRASVTALEASRDAWRAKASPSLPKRLAGHAPAILAGAVLAGIVR
jgi:hypothetical protein